MGYRWFQNYFQFPMEGNYDDRQMQEIPYPYFELGIHVTMKTVQTGSFIGGWILPAIVHSFNQTTTLKNKMKLYGRYGVLIGLLAGPIVEFARVKQAKISREDAKERCYRLRYNKKQLFVDRTALVGAALGFYTVNWLGLINGLNGSIVFSTLYNKFIWNFVPRKWHDMCEEPPLYKPPKRRL